MSEQFVAVQDVWDQVSGDYDAAKRTRTFRLFPTTTVAEIMAWANYRSLGVGDVRIVASDAAITEEGRKP